ncbi:hypothetical protein BMS3Bbin15_00778 [archaeon BMS3Bbin15]|nr:hypothetical protein BMS3Bbin15_00778 [archaeon BMS3Bbin15]
MAKFRNRLIHIYWEVDDDIIYNILQEDIQDIERLIDKLIGSLRKGDRTSV